MFFFALLQNGRKSGLPKNGGNGVRVENLRPRAVAYNKRVMESRSLDEKHNSSGPICIP